jgi:hypothetical protein
MSSHVGFWVEKKFGLNTLIWGHFRIYMFDIWMTRLKQLKPSEQEHHSTRLNISFGTLYRLEEEQSRFPSTCSPTYISHIYIIQSCIQKNKRQARIWQRTQNPKINMDHWSMIINLRNDTPEVFCNEGRCDSTTSTYNQRQCTIHLLFPINSRLLLCRTTRMQLACRLK